MELSQKKLYVKSVSHKEICAIPSGGLYISGTCLKNHMLSDSDVLEEEELLSSDSKLIYSVCA